MRQLTAVTAGWLARIAVVACSLLNTRLLLSILDVPAYAAYAIVLSLGPWFNLLNLGVPNTAQNAISRKRAAKADYGALQQTAVNAALLAAAASALLAWPIGWALSNSLLTAYPMASSGIVATMCFGLCLTALGLVSNQVLFALHRGIWPNVMPGLQAVASLAMLLLMRELGLQGLEWAVLAFVMPALLVFVMTARIAGALRSCTLDVSVLRKLLRDSRPFMLFAVLSTGALSADYIVMAKVLAGPDIVEYNLASKVFSVLLAVHAVVLSTSWSVLSDLHYSGKLDAMRRTVLRLMGVGAAVVLPPALCVVAWHGQLFHLIGGARAVPISASLLSTWVVYLLTRVWCDTFALAHMSCGKLATLNVYVAVQTAISVAAQWMLGARWGATGILAGITLSFLLTAAWILPFKFVSLTRAVPQP